LEFEEVSILSFTGNAGAAVENAKNTEGKPTAIIAKTIKGKGVSYMENQVGWHGKAPNEEQYAIAMKEFKGE